MDEPPLGEPPPLGEGEPEELGLGLGLITGVEPLGFGCGDVVLCEGLTDADGPVEPGGSECTETGAWCALPRAL